MKKSSILLICLVLGYMSFAQISTKQLPRSFELKQKIETNVKSLPSPDVDELMYEDEQNASLYKNQRCGVAVQFKEDFFENATHTEMSDYDLYTLQINIPYAQAIGLSSDKFHLPEGGELYLYNPDRSKILGAYTSDNNSEDGIFSTEYVYGEDMIIEYYQPKQIKEKAQIELSDFKYFYRDIIHFEDIPRKEFRSSGTCNVNINCSEGNNYRDVKRAVVRIEIKGGYNYYWCTGTVVNTANYSKLPYIISTGHCCENSSASDFSYWVFYFNYETSGCNTGYSEPGYTSHNGSTRLAYEDSYGANGTDYLLVKLRDNFTTSDNVYFAGWTRSSTAPSNGVGIHHPAGDVKKISTFTSRPMPSEAYTSTHWKVVWAETTNGYGIVEGGSSGSGLFNPNGLLVATLTGGYSDCSQSSTMQKDWYGRFYLQFPYLSQWLDPNSTTNSSNHPTVLGMSYADTVPASTQTIETQNLSFDFYPNPAQDQITINLPKNANNAVLAILDEQGRTMLSRKVGSANATTSFDISSLVDGVYFIRLYCNQNSYVQKFIKQ